MVTDNKARIKVSQPDSRVGQSLPRAGCFTRLKDNTVHLSRYVWAEKSQEPGFLESKPETWSTSETL